MQTLLKNVVTSYPHLFEMHKFESDPPEKADYSSEFIFMPDFDYTELQAAVAAAMAEKFPTRVSDPNFMATMVSPYKQVGDGPYQGYAAIKAYGRKNRPMIVAQDGRTPVTDAMLLQAGSKVNVQINVFGYEHSGKHGAGFTLNLMQLVQTADGVSLPLLGGEVQKPEDWFTPIQGAQNATPGVPAQGTPATAMGGSPSPQQPAAGSPPAQQAGPGAMPPGVAPNPPFPA